MAISLVSRNEDKFDALIIENTFLSVVSYLKRSIKQIQRLTHTLSLLPIAFASATYISSIETFSIFGTSDMEIIQDDQIRTSCTYTISVQSEG